MLISFFSIFACKTSNTLWFIYRLSQDLTKLANDFPAFFALPVKVTNMLLLFFSILACRSEEHTSELQSHLNLVCRLLLEKKKQGTSHRQRAVGTTVTGHGSPPDSAVLIATTHASHAARCRCAPAPHPFTFFFLKDGATPEFSPLPHPAPLPI